MQSWTNWSGSLSFTPQQFREPQHENELCHIVQSCKAAGKKGAAGCRRAFVVAVGANGAYINSSSSF